MDARWFLRPFVAVDVETTGLDPARDRVVEIGWARVALGRCVEADAVLVDPGVPMPAEATRVSGLDDAALRGAPRFADVAARLADACAGAAFVVAWNAPFDRAFLAAEHLRAARSGPRPPWIDPLVFARALLPDTRHRLFDVARRLRLNHARPHRARDDAVAAAEVLLRLAPALRARTVDDALAVQRRWASR
jgi:DNA polymerase III subunit epsilon